jgi:hypothetical protein
LHPARGPLGLETLPPRTRSTFERSNFPTLVVLEVGESSVFHHPYIIQCAYNLYINIYLHIPANGEELQETETRSKQGTIVYHSQFGTSSLNFIDPGV